jgi:hypothetical protein
MIIDLIDFELRYVRVSFEFDPQSRKIINFGVYFLINFPINFTLAQ